MKIVIPFIKFITKVPNKSNCLREPFSTHCELQLVHSDFAWASPGAATGIGEDGARKFDIFGAGDLKHKPLKRIHCLGKIMAPRSKAKTNYVYQIGESN